MKWIKCSEQMPFSQNNQCLVLNGQEISIGNLYMQNNNEFRWILNSYGGSTADLNEVTHWMSLPELPNE